MTSPQDDPQKRSSSIDRYLTMLETEIGQMNRALLDLEGLVRKFEADRRIDHWDAFFDKEMPLSESCRQYSAEILTLFPTIEDGIINLNGEERKAFLGYRGRYDVVRNELTNIRRNLFEHEEELKEMQD